MRVKPVNDPVLPFPLVGTSALFLFDGIQQLWGFRCKNIQNIQQFDTQINITNKPTNYQAIHYTISMENRKDFEDEQITWLHMVIYMYHFFLI